MNIHSVFNGFEAGLWIVFSGILLFQFKKTKVRFDLLS